MKYRSYRNNKIETWIIRKCRVCGQFMSKFSHGLLCSICAEKVNNSVESEIRTYTKKTLREMFSPIMISRWLEKQLGSVYL